MFKRFWPVVMGCIAYAAMCAILYSRIGRVTDGIAIYPLDDAYIQAAMGKNLALYHSYGISPGVFGAASSSVIWPFLLAITYKVFGIQIWVPLLWNILLAVLLIFAVDCIIRRFIPDLSQVARAVFLIAFVLLTSLPTITFVAMEHILQALTTLLFIFFAGQSLASAAPGPAQKRYSDTWLFAAAFCTTLSRFEGGFAIAVVFILFAVRRRFATAFGVAVSGALPLIAFALFSIRHGGHALPNSLLMKAAGNKAVAHRIILFSGNGLLSPYSRHQGLAAVFLVAVLLLGAGLLKKIALPTALKFSLGIYAAAVILHCQLARLGLLGRYEFYLITVGAVLCGSALLSVFRLGKTRDIWVCSGVATLLVVALLPRALDEWGETIHSSQATFSDAVQDARFLHTYYNDASIVANDVGAISYFTNVQCLDLAALGSDEVADLVLDGNLTRATVAQAARNHHARIALVFKSRLFSSTSEPDIIPQDWIEEGHIAYPDVPDLNATYFMAIDPVEAAPLRQHMLEFFPQLPPMAHAVVDQPH
jgi:hypothetical protein